MINTVLRYYISHFLILNNRFWKFEKVSNYISYVHKAGSLKRKRQFYGDIVTIKTTWFWFEYLSML